MAWYRTGTVTVTNDSATVTGAATDFVGNTSVGEAFLGPNGVPMEIAQVVSATQIVLASAYTGGTAAGQGFATMPTQSFARDLALGAAQLLNTFAAVRDGIGQGLIADGSAGTPAIRFSADQDTGIYRLSPNTLNIAVGGGVGASFSPARVDFSGHIHVGEAKAVGFLPDVETFGFSGISVARYGTTQGIIIAAGARATLLSGYSGIIFATADTERMRIDQGGTLLVGTLSGSEHALARSVAAGGGLLRVFSSVTNKTSAIFLSVDDEGYTATAAALWMGRATLNGRSINAGGTINASGADYAEYMTKAAGCGTIAPGDVCGVDADGHLTRTWADAVSFVIKSTDPAYVGGDTWAAHLSPRPEQDEDEDDAVFAERLDGWEAELEAARVTVDRIAFAGQVPVNVTADATPGDYLVAASNGAGIKVVPIAAADITFDQYQRRLGRVWAIRDDRPWVDVQHG